MKTFKTLAAMGILLLAATTYAPTASAHECTAEYNSPQEAECGGPCKEGEYHEHKITHHHENGIFEDENHVHYSCSTKEEGPGPSQPRCSTPRVAGICLISEDDAGFLADYLNTVVLVGSGVAECASDSLGLTDPLNKANMPSMEAPDPDSLIEIQGCGP